MLSGASGSKPMPRKIAGMAIKTMDAFIVDIRTAAVVFDNATHLYPLSVSRLRAAPPIPLKLTSPLRPSAAVP